MKAFFFMVGFMSGFGVYCQNIGDPCPSYKDSVIAGAVLFDSARYEAAIALCEKVPAGDSVFTIARYEKAMALYKLKKYSQAIKLSKEAIAEKDNMSREHYLLAGNAFDMNNQPDSAIGVYRRGLTEFPFYFRSYYEMAVLYKKRKEHNLAFENLRNALLLNPFHPVTHKTIGVYAAQANHFTLALMALQFSAMLENNNNRLFASIDLMEKIADGEYKPDTVLAPEIFKQPAVLEEIDQIVNSRVANTEAYKGISKLNFRIVKQMQIICEKLPPDIGTDNFFIGFYARFYKQIWDKKMFEGMAVFMLKDVNTPLVQKEVKKKKSAVDAYKTYALGYLTRSREKGNEPAAQEYAGKTFFYEGQKLVAIGKTEAEVKTGKWLIFNDNGRIKGEGSFLNNKQEGEWKFYHDNGNLLKVLTYKNGLPAGKYTVYFSNGFVQEEGTYNNGKIDGKAKSYYQNGALKEEYIFKEDKADGPASSFDEAGYKNAEYNNKAGKLNGTFRKFDNTGKKTTEGNYKDDLLHGSYYTFFRNGKKASEFTYTEGKANGKYTSWFKNGKIKMQGDYKNDQKAGIWKEFYEHGTLFCEENYKEGKQTGVNKYYDLDGTVFAEYTYSSGNLQSYKFSDKTGKVIVANKVKSGKIWLEKYNALGIKISEATVANGVFQGVYKDFHPGGKTETEVNMVADRKNGIQKRNYKNGKIYSELNYVNGQLQGYGKTYYKNGKVQAEGYYLDNEKNGIWKYYFENGQLDSEEYYIRGLLNGFDNEYLANGKLLSRSFYNQGFRQYILNYDSAGKLLKKVIFKAENTEYREAHLTGKPLSRFNYRYGFLHGKQSLNYPNGKPRSDMEYVGGSQERAAKAYHENGKPAFSGNYVSNRKDSTWTYFDIDGRKEKVENYQDGEMNGKLTFFYENGSPELERNYLNDLRHGESITYAPDGTVKIKILYYKGILTGYTYKDKSGNFVPVIPVLNASAKIKSLYPNGNTSMEWELKDGFNEGDFKEYYPDGKIYEWYRYKNGDREGTQKTFYPNGKIKTEYTSFGDEFHGDYREYYENGSLKYQKKYYLGQLHGKSSQFDSNGKLISVTNYYMDNAY